MEKKKVDILGIKLLSFGKEVHKDGFYGLPLTYQCKLDDGSQYLTTSIRYSHESRPLDNSAIGLIVIPQPNGIIFKYPNISTTAIASYGTQNKKENFSPDIELNGNDFKATYATGDYEVGVAVLVPAEYHVDFTMSE